MEELTVEEQNFIKDMLQFIGNDEKLRVRLAFVTNRGWAKSEALSDSIFKKLQNGRLTVMVS
jgi:hypothetical protein